MEVQAPPRKSHFTRALKQALEIPPFPFGPNNLCRYVDDVLIRKDPMQGIFAPSASPSPIQ